MFNKKKTLNFWQIWSLSFGFIFYDSHVSDAKRLLNSAGWWICNSHIWSSNACCDGWGIQYCFPALQGISG